MNLSKPSVVKELLGCYGLKPSKSLGQNFLVDVHYLSRIVSAADITQGDTIVEIGPGLGTLTRALAESGASVLAIEKDRRLQPVLAETLNGLPVQLITADALEVNYLALLQGATQPKIVANLPYYITTPLILGFLRSKVSWRSLVILVQEEVVRRIMAEPGQKEYGLLGITVQYFTCPSLITTVPASAFYPPPQVSSAVVKLLPQDTSVHGLQAGEEKLFRVVKAALGQRRKTLLNALEAILGFPRVDLRRVIADLGWSLDRRGETLSVGEFVALTNQLYVN